MLLKINDVLTSQQLSDIRKKLDTANWIDGKHTAGSHAAIIKSNLQSNDQCDITKNLSNTLLTTLGKHPQFIAAALPNKVLPPKFNCYQNGGHYGNHIDNAVMPFGNSSQLMRSDLSATLFLSDPHDYDRGELIIESDYGDQSIKLAAGDLVLYPSTSLHRVTPVTRGKRLCAFFWVQSMVRDVNHRKMLYDLDQSIQTLTRERGYDDLEVNKLTGIYHNLIRQWADV